MVHISDLYALQEIDSQIDALERTLVDLRSRQGNDDSVAGAKERLIALDEAAAEAAREQRAADEEVADGRPKLSAVEEKLYSGTVTNSKELRDLQRELEALQRQQAQREEAALAAMTHAEESRVEAQAATQSLHDGEAAWGEEQQQIAAQLEQIEVDREHLRNRRQVATQPVDAQTMALYERLRRMRRGEAVARVQRGACLGCRIMLPSQIFQKARSGMAVVQCSSCERILYVG